jgi:excisionase family DNA binding protein
LKKENGVLRMVSENRNKESFITIPHAAARLDCSTKSIYRLIECGELRGSRVFTGLRVLESSLDLYIERQIKKFEFEQGVDEYLGTGVDYDALEDMTREE